MIEYGLLLSPKAHTTCSVHVFQSFETFYVFFGSLTSSTGTVLSAEILIISRCTMTIIKKTINGLHVLIKSPYHQKSTSPSRSFVSFQSKAQKWFAEEMLGLEVMNQHTLNIPTMKATCWNTSIQPRRRMMMMMIYHLTLLPSMVSGQIPLLTPSPIFAGPKFTHAQQDVNQQLLAATWQMLALCLVVRSSSSCRIKCPVLFVFLHFYLKRLTK